MMRKREKTDGSQGFTLLEVMVAVVILGLAYVAVLQNFSFSLRNIVRVEASKEGTLSAALDFENTLQPPADQEAAAGDELAGTVFLEGQKYDLVLVTSEDDQFVSLKLARPGMTIQR